MMLNYLNNLDITRKKIDALYNFVIKNHNHYKRGTELKEIISKDYDI